MFAVLRTTNRNLGGDQRVQRQRWHREAVEVEATRLLDRLRIPADSRHLRKDVEVSLGCCQRERLRIVERARIEQKRKRGLDVSRVSAPTLEKRGERREIVGRG